MGGGALAQSTISARRSFTHTHDDIHTRYSHDMHMSFLPPLAEHGHEHGAVWAYCVRVRVNPDADRRREPDYLSSVYTGKPRSLLSSGNESVHPADSEREAPLTLTRSSTRPLLATYVPFVE